MSREITEFAGYRAQKVDKQIILTFPDTYSRFGFPSGEIVDAEVIEPKQIPDGSQSGEN